MSKRVGIDIGSTAVRVVEVSGTDSEGMAQITKGAVATMPAGAMAGGRIKDAVAVAFAVRKAVKEAKVSPYGVIVGVSSPDAALATFAMPGAVSSGEWVEVLRLEEKRISPKIDMADSALSVNRIGSVTDGEGNLTNNILAAALQASEVDAVMEVCRLARITPRAIDHAGAAAFRGLLRIAPDDGSVNTLVDIGASKITVATRQGLHLRSVRTIEAGGDNITRNLMGATGNAFDSCEDSKRAMRIGMPATGKARSSLAAALENRFGVTEESTVIEEDRSDVAQESLTTSADNLIEEIAAAVEQDEAQHPGAPTQAIVLCGAGSLLQGLPERLQARLGRAAFIGRPWVKVIPGPRTAALTKSGLDDQYLVLSMVTAAGLALWKETH